MVNIPDEVRAAVQLCRFKQGGEQCACHIPALKTPQTPGDGGPPYPGGGAFVPNR
jgi:hypothetical protein